MTSSAYPPHWHSNVERVAEALRRSGSTHGVDDVLRMLRSDERVYWIATPDTFMMAEIVDYPLKRVINGSLVGGQRHEVLMFEDRMCDFARQAGCVEAQITGRPGWQRVLPGYRCAAVMLRKSLVEGG